MFARKDSSFNRLVLLRVPIGIGTSVRSSTCMRSSCVMRCDAAKVHSSSSTASVAAKGIVQEDQLMSEESIGTESERLKLRVKAIKLSRKYAAAQFFHDGELPHPPAVDTHLH